MALTLSSLNNARSTVIVDFQSEQFSVTYNPALLTREFLDSMPNTFNGTYEALSKIVVDWDIKVNEKDKTNLGTDVESMSVLPLPVVQAIFQKIMEDVNDGSQGKASGDSSLPPETSGSFPTGTK